MASKISSFDDKVKLPVTETISRFYQPQQNKKAIRILTVAVYVLCVSLAAIMLSLYYIFIWDPTVKPFMPKVTNCDKIIIPEQIAIRLTNYTEISADQFYKNILQHYQQQQQRRNIKYRKKFILNLPTTTSTTISTRPAPSSSTSSTAIAESGIQIENSKSKSKILSSIIMSTISPTATSTRISSTMTNPSSSPQTTNNDFIDGEIPIDYRSETKSQYLNIAPKQKVIEPFMKTLEMYHHHNRRVNSDDEDYTDDQYDDEASGHYLIDIS